MCPCMCPWSRGLRSQIPPGCATSCALACAPGSAGSGAKFVQDVHLHVPACALASEGSKAKFLQDAPPHVPLHVPLAPRALEPNSSRMCPCMCPWSQIPPGCVPSCAPACAPGSAISGAKFLQDGPLHVPLHVPLAPRAPEPNSSRMRPFMCPWLRELRSQIPPGCDPSCAPACAHGAGANCSTIRTFDDVEAAAAPGKEAHRMWATNNPRTTICLEHPTELGNVLDQLERVGVW